MTVSCCAGWQTVNLLPDDHPLKKVRSHMDPDREASPAPVEQLNPGTLRPCPAVEHMHVKRRPEGAAPGTERSARA